MLPAGAPIFEMAIDSGKLISSFDELWDKDFGPYGKPWRFDLPESFSDHPSLPSLVRTVCGGSYFRGSNYWASDWLDDGDNDPLWAGDADVKAEISFYIQNERQTGSGSGNFSSSSTSTHSQTQSSSTTTSSNVGVSVGGHEGAPSGQINAGVSNTTGTSSTITSTGQGGLSMTAPAQRVRADIIMEIKLTFRPSITGPAPKSRKMFTPVVGSILMGAPLE